MLARVRCAAMVSAKMQQQQHAARAVCSSLGGELACPGESSLSSSTAISLHADSSSTSLATHAGLQHGSHSCGSNQPWLNTQQQRTKSLKRKAAEALLSGRYSTPPHTPPPASAAQPAAGPTLSPPPASAQQPPLHAADSAAPAQPPIFSASPPCCSCAFEPQPELPNPHFPTFAASGLHATTCSRSASLEDPELTVPQGSGYPNLHSGARAAAPTAAAAAVVQEPPLIIITQADLLLLKHAPPSDHDANQQQSNDAKRQRIDPSQQLHQYQQQLQQLQRQQQQVALKQKQQVQQQQQAQAHSVHTFVPAPEATARSHRLVPACPPTCPTHSSWCNFEVRIPNVDWDRVFQDSPSTYSYSILSKGFDKYYMGQGLAVYMVDNPAHAPEAIARLRTSMQDPVITIDLEWRPEFKAGESNQVALMQLSSSTVCVLMHVSSMSYQLPQAVKDLLADPKVQILGFGWDTADEKKMQGTFDMGRSNFGNFLDLQEIARQLSFPSGMGLLRLTKQVLGHELTKTKTLSRSNWSLRFLSLHQIKYAAMDVFACGQVFRALRLWHSSPSACPGCHELVGALLPQPILQCPSTKRIFKEMKAYLQNAEKLKVPTHYKHCQTCGRYVRNHSAPKEGSEASA